MISAGAVLCRSGVEARERERAAVRACRALSFALRGERSGSALSFGLIGKVRSDGRDRSCKVRARASIWDNRIDGDASGSFNKVSVAVSARLHVTGFVLT